MQSSPTTASAPATGLNFLGVGNGFSGPTPPGSFTVNSAPPDTNGAVGASQYVQWVNESFAVFDKSTGVVKYGPAAGNTLWSGFGGACQTDNDGDPIAQYDKTAQRWVMTQFAVASGPPYHQCFAVSTTSDATGTFNRYSFSFANFPDYPKLGVWPDAYYMSFNMFVGGTTFAGADACAFDRADMLITGAAAKPAQCFQQGTSVASLLPSDLDGANLPPAGKPAYFLNIPNATTATTLGLWKFHTDWTTPASSTFTGPTNITVASFTQACQGGTCVPQSGTTTKLDSLADRLMYRLAYRNFGDHESLVVNHSVVAGTASGVRWYELRTGTGTTSAVGSGAFQVYQSGTYAPTDGAWRWMGSVAMDAVGDMAVGYSKSSSTAFPSINYTGRVSTDPLGALETEATLFVGSGSQTGHPALTRWGDYSAMSIDPVDDCTFWYTNEYLPANGSFNWSTRIGNFKFAGCPGQSPQGNWVGSYGADGYALGAWNDTTDLVSMPLSGLTLDNALRGQWSSSSTAVQALESPDASTRRETYWYAWDQIRLHLIFPNAYTGTLHLYACDYEVDSRRETVTINDGSGPRTADISSDFSQGAWVNVPIAVSAGGSVTISVTLTGGPNAVLSGIFLGSPLPPAPTRPTNLTVTTLSSSQIRSSWTASIGATSYKIQRSPDGSTGWTQVGGSTATTFTDTGLNPSTTYFYRVLASNAGGDSVPSSVASATTAAGLAYSQSPQGNWVGSYGADGYALGAWNDTTDLVSMPLSGLTLDNALRGQWSSSSTAVQALESPDASARRETYWYAWDQIRLHLIFPNAYTGTLHLYACDYEADSRRETVTINDGSGPRTADISSDFSQGAWVNVPIAVSAGGSVTISVTLTGGPNAVLSGIFLG